MEMTRKQRCLLLAYWLGKATGTNVEYYSNPTLGLALIHSDHRLGTKEQEDFKKLGVDTNFNYDKEFIKGVYVYDFAMGEECVDPLFDWAKKNKDKWDADECIDYINSHVRA